MDRDQYVPIAEVGRPHGIQGELRLKVYNLESDLLLEKPDVRLVTAWALYNIRDVSTTSALDAAFRKEADAEVQEGLLQAMGALGDVSIDVLQRLVTSPDSTVRRMAVASLAKSDGLGPWPWPWPEPRPYP